MLFQKKIFVGIFSLLVLSMPLSVEAKTFYGKMNDSLLTRQDLKDHYQFHRKLGTLLRFAPSQYQILGLAGASVASFVGKEVIWDLILRQGHFDMTDAAANFKGLKDGMNGVDAFEENKFKENLQKINSLTKQLVYQTQTENIVQKANIAALEDQNEQLRKIYELRTSAEIKPVSNIKPAN